MASTDTLDRLAAGTEKLKLHNGPPTPDESDDSKSEQSDECSFPLPPTTSIPDKVLDIDKKTPDNHVPRDPRLIRLTGTHPFNVEAPLTDLFNQGFLTSPELFYVRNHGAVPQVLDADILDWEFCVEGLVEKPFTLSLKSLIADYEQFTVPITLVCAGNRRKEQNQVRKSKGFSWGAGGVSTALFTGVFMSEIIKKARPRRGARYVCMEGADKLPNGYYGTNVKLNWVMDPNRAIMLSYKMNGEMLRPDHGKPLRAVVPGQIGGRSVKWLKKLIVTEGPSDNWYHIYDNRVLPTSVSPEESAKGPEWWTDERYAIYDLNVNSAIACPAHGEELPLDSPRSSYEIKGYAYSGGGKRITRVEISLNKGVTWQLATVNYPEDLYRDTEQDIYGSKLDMWWRENSFCWAFWFLEVPLSDLKSAADILVRAMDESMQIQPRDMYWSVLGMMNNPWFRVCIERRGDCLKFEHPTQPALMPGGWMERVKKAGGNLTNGHWGEKIGGEQDTQEVVEVAEVKMTKAGVDKVITIDELRKHDSGEKPWFVVGGEVYDGTAFMSSHPGGAQSIISAAGLDSSEEFMAIHSENAKGMMPDHHIGTLDQAGRKALAEGETNAAPTEKTAFFLNQRSWQSCDLVKKKVVSWDTRIFTFKLQHDEQTLGLPVGQHIMLRLKDPTSNEAVIRSYTPISDTKKPGYLDILIKIYFTTKEAKGGKMTQAMDSLPLGGSIDVKGPIGKFEYKGKGDILLNGVPRKVKSFCMICGGSGITPIFQVFRAIMQDREDTTRCIVLDGNRLPEDILCKDELEQLCEGNDHRAKVVHTLSKPADDWTGLKGRINQQLLREHVVEDGQTMVLICGPEALEKSVHKVLQEDGWKDSDLVFF